MSKPPHGPLQGVKVVSCSTAQAGTVPYMLMADLGADVIKIETAGRRRRLAPHDGAAGHAQHLLRDQQSRREERHAQSQDAGGQGDPAQARRQGRHLRPELPAGCGREERLRLRGAAQDQPEARLCLDLGLRHQGPERPSARHQFDGAGAGRHRRGLFRCRARRCAPASPRWPTNRPPCWRSAARWRRSPTRAPPASARRSSCRCSARWCG